MRKFNLTCLKQKEPEQVPKHPCLRTLPQILARRLPRPVLALIPRHHHRRKQVLANKLLERALAQLLPLRHIVGRRHG
jgi:hypothetical protein